jgi:hypothetical protein
MGRGIWVADMDLGSQDNLVVMVFHIMAMVQVVPEDIAVEELVMER